MNIKKIIIYQLMIDALQLFKQKKMKYAIQNSKIIQLIFSILIKKELNHH